MIVACQAQNWPLRPRSFSYSPALSPDSQRSIDADRETRYKGHGLTALPCCSKRGVQAAGKRSDGCERVGAGAHAPFPPPRFMEGGEEMIQCWRARLPLAVWSLLAAAWLLIAAYGGMSEAGAGAAETISGGNALIGTLEGPEIIT